jgi:hypothetical protein
MLFMKQYLPSRIQTKFVSMCTQSFDVYINIRERERERERKKCMC